MTEEAATQVTETAEPFVPYSGEQDIAPQAAIPASETLPPEALPPVDPEPPVAPQPIETILAPETFEGYLREELLEKGNGFGHLLRFEVVAEITPAGDVKFYIHPLYQDGKTRDFEVMGEVVRNITRIAM